MEFITQKALRVRQMLTPTGDAPISNDATELLSQTLPVSFHNNVQVEV
jgi:hypothetical protein